MGAERLAGRYARNSKCIDMRPRIIEHQTRPVSLRSIIFDLDGTLGDTLGVVVASFQATLEAFGLPAMSTEEIFGYFGPTEDGVIREIFGGRAPDAIAVYYKTFEFLQEAEPKVFPGVIAMLERCRAAGIRCGIVTGKSDRGAQITVRALGLSPFFDGVLGGSDEGVVKSAQISRLVTRWGVDARECAYIGDHPIDIAEARDAGVMALCAGWAPTTDLETVMALNPDDTFLSVAAFVRWLDLDQELNGGKK